MRKFIYLVLVLSLIGLGVYTYWYQRTKVFINPIDLAQFNQLTPLSGEACKQEDAIEYFYYQEVPEGEKRNNKFGLYIYPDNEKFIDLADDLVNSSDGDWGYVLIPHDINDNDEKKWERVFYLLNKNHLIPVVQLWNIDPDDYEDETKDAAEFLDSFIWPIRQRYISVYNEPNDAKFWNGNVDPEKYAEVLDFTINTFKKQSENFFMINGGLNVSASTTSTSLEAFNYMIRMNEAVPGIFRKLDGWASHSYPQPNFSGSPYATGRSSIKAYEAELDFLAQEFGVENLPVFITETGWAHDVGKSFNNSYLSLDQVAENFKTAYEEVWLPDDRVVAVMPFSIRYDTPFDHFSWVDDDYRPYTQFLEVKEMDKIEGNPEKLLKADVSSLGC